MKIWTIVIFTCVMAGLLAAHTAMAQTNVLIHRGSQTEFLGKAKVEPGVIVERGSVPAHRPAAPLYAAATGSEGVSLQAGSTLWILDNATQRLKACKLRSTGHIGERFIRCYDDRRRY